ncbi:MAG: lipoyl synthase [Candidatus Micrarchaeota archaeon]|nr:lipoyl synthase [Candidatus Micrarchaeota archaeon]
MLPDWLAIKPANTERYGEIKQTIDVMGLHTVCVEAHCPNITECWSAGTATFMILGGTCTRGCRFCAVQKRAIGEGIDMLEPTKLAAVIKKWGLDYVVLTSVCRDDLPDQGSGHFAACVREIKKACANTLVEVLIPDFRGDVSCLQRIVDAKPDVIGHNIETVERLNPVIRDRRANYSQSLKVLQTSKQLDRRIYTKSAMMLGVGETEEEIIKALQDLRANGVDFVAIGQYLRPSQHHYEVKEYVMPEKFERLRKKALELGFLYVAAGPFVRSSYKAGEYFVKRLIQNR